MSATVTLIIPTLNAYENLRQSPHLASIIQSTPTLIIDSSSSDDTVAYAQGLGAQVRIIPKESFNHGATREYARTIIPSDIVVFLTQDAIPVAADVLGQLIAPLLANPEVAVSYGRQLPRPGAGLLEAFPREFNYGSNAQLRALADIPRYGVYTFFCSNSCAAYKNAALDRIGGFKSVLTNEDYFATAELLLQGYQIAYVPEAQVWHSHAYTLQEEFQRYFATGYVRAQHPQIQQLVGQAEQRGREFIQQLLRKIYQQQPLLLPYAVLHTLIKWLGYRFGFYAYQLSQFVASKR